MLNIWTYAARRTSYNRHLGLYFGGILLTNIDQLLLFGHGVSDSSYNRLISLTLHYNSNQAELAHDLNLTLDLASKGVHYSRYVFIIAIALKIRKSVELFLKHM